MNTSHIRRAVCFFSALLTLFFVSTISAQEFRGTIAGTITDPNGAVVPGASVTVKNVATNITSSTTSNDEGVYTVPLLPSGAYTVSATGNGFKTSTIENVTVQVDDRLTIDIQLQVGAAAEVNIVAGGDVIEQGSVTTGTLVTSRQIEELPLAEGAPYTLSTQAPGIVYTGDPNFQGPTANGNLAGFRSNGTQGNQVNASGGNVINLDGSPNLAYDGQVAFTPPSEATQEFKVQTNTFDAQMGFTAGATVNVAIKSGTNDFHGAAYLYDRDKSRTANNFFNNRAGLDRPERKYNRYGAMISGPIFKDKTFFLFSYERQKDNVAQTTTYSVPTAQMRQGNFSELLGAQRTVTLTLQANGQPNCAGAVGTVVPLTNRDGSPALAGAIYNPFSGQSVNRCNPITGAMQTQVERLPFAGNIITPGLIYGPSLAFMQYFPEANLPGFLNNFITDQNLSRPYRSYMVKIDHNINDKNRISGKYYHSRNTEDRYNLTMEPGSIFQGFENRRNHGGNVNWTSTLSSNWIFDLRGSWGMFKLRRFQDGQPTAGDLGFTGIPSDRQDNVFPRFDYNANSYMTVGSQRADWNDGRDRPFDMFTIQPTVTQILGNHTLKYGYDFRRLHETFDYDGYASGRFLFQGTYTMRNQNDGNAERDRVGRDLAAFLLGVPVANANSLIDNPQVYDVASKYHGFFIHDDFRVSQKLTLNLGLRYEVEGGFKEKEGRMVVDFSRTAESPIRNAVLTNYNANVPSGVPIAAFQNLAGGFIFASNPGDANQSADKNNWQPRIGVSYAIDDKTVIRAGFGIFTAPFQIVSQNVIFQPGFSTPTLFVPTTNNGATFTATLGNAFTNVPVSPGNSQGLMTFVGRDLTAANANGPTSIVLQNERENANYSRFILGVQREVWGGIGLEATYVYSKGSNLAVNRELNAIPAQFLNNLEGVTAAGTISTAIATVNSNLNANVPNPFRTLVPGSSEWNATNIQRRRLLTPFPQFGNVAVTEYDGSSEYQSLQLQIVKRFTKGLSLNGSYTYSREHLKNQYLNPQDTELTEYISPNERPHRWTMSAIYEIPLGKGRSFGSGWNSFVDAIFGGWQVQGLYEWQSGEPLQLPNVFYNGDPNQLKSMLGKRDSQGRRYGIDIPAWDICGFYTSNCGQTNAVAPVFGNNYTSSGTNTLRYFPLTVDGLRNQRFLKFDVGLSKNFRIREGMKLQVRVDAINLLNRPYFSSPTVNPATLPTTTSGVTNFLGTFGYTTAPVRQPPRDIQIGGRFTF